MRSTCRRDEEAYMERKSGRKDGTSGHGRSVYSPDTHTIPHFHSPLKRLNPLKRNAHAKMTMKPRGFLFERR